MKAHEVFLNYIIFTFEKWHFYFTMNCELGKN